MVDVERPKHGSMGCDMKEPEPVFTVVVHGRFVGTTMEKERLETYSIWRDWECQRSYLIRSLVKGVYLSIYR